MGVSGRPGELILDADMELDADRIQRVFGIPRRDWKRILRQNLETATQVETTSLSLFGYPELHQVSFYLTAIGLRLWKNEGSILLPDLCCVCQRASRIWLPTDKSDGEFYNGRHSVSLARVPHCEIHGSRESAELLFDAGSFSPNAVWAAVMGVNASFLHDVLALNQSGDVPPPWEAFPNQNSYSGFWKQSGEPWMATVFRPFWKKLETSEKCAYLERWSAPADWREWLTLIDRF